MLTTNIAPECDSCLSKKIHTPATTKAIHPDYAAYELCEDCAAELNRVEPYCPYPPEDYAVLQSFQAKQH